MMGYYKNILLVLLVLPFAACTQYTPSMINTQPLRVEETTMIEQIPLAHINEATLEALAQHYGRYGSGAVALTMQYNPVDKVFTAAKAVSKLHNIRGVLKRKNVSHITASTLAVPEGEAGLMVSYNTLQASAPADCALIPGIIRHGADQGTTRFLPDYNFGCSTDTMLAKQVARPADLLGNDVMDDADGRRAALVSEAYNSGTPAASLEQLGRDDIGN